MLPCQSPFNKPCLCFFLTQTGGFAVSRLLLAFAFLLLAVQLGKVHVGFRVGGGDVG